MTRDRLAVSTMHRVLSGPLGLLLTGSWFERARLSLLPREFRGARARAVAFAYPEVDRFFEVLEIDGSLARRLRPRAERALAELARRRADLREIQRRWDDAFWQGADVDMERRVDLERTRRRCSERAIKPSSLFRFLAAMPSIAPAHFSTPSPRAALAEVQSWLREPDRLYAAPSSHDARPERSAPVRGPHGMEFLLRFASPSSFTNDVVTARVYEPSTPDIGTPTFIYGSGLGMLYDLIEYWPEEDYLARRLAARGIRVVLPESPWHGRRELPGRYSGEPYLERAPVSLFELFAAQAGEAAYLIAWARAHGSKRTGIGGFSLGALVAQQVAGRCSGWPAEMRPDMAFIGAGSTRIDRVVMHGDIADLLGMTETIDRAGWTAEDLARLRPLLDPPSKTGIDPSAILAFLGRKDQSTPYAFAKDLMDRWRVPERNRMVFDAGHIGLYSRIIRNDEAAKRIARLLMR